MVLNEPDSARVQARFAGWAEERTRLIAPVIMLYEVHTVLNQQVRRKLMDAGERSAGWSTIRGLGITVPESGEFWTRAWELADRLGQAATFDMHYLAMAEARNCELWTLDQALIRATKGGPWKVRTV